MLIICVENFESKNLAGRKGGWMDGWMGGWMDGWMGGWMEGKARLRIAYSNQKLHVVGCIIDHCISDIFTCTQHPHGLLLI